MRDFDYIADIIHQQAHQSIAGAQNDVHGKLAVGFKVADQAGIRAPVAHISHPEHTEAMQAASENKSPGARDEAKKFLLAILAAGPVAKTEIEEAAKAEGIAERTLYRAKRELKNIIARKDAADGGWTWRLCDDGEGS